MNTQTAIVTGATSGLGFEAAAQLAEEGWASVTITGRNAERAQAAAEQLKERTGKDVFETLVVDLNKSTSVTEAATELARRGDSIDLTQLDTSSRSTRHFVSPVAGSRTTRNDSPS